MIDFMRYIKSYTVIFWYLSAVRSRLGKQKNLLKISRVQPVKDHISNFQRIDFLTADATTEKSIWLVCVGKGAKWGHNQRMRSCNFVSRQPH